MSSGVVSVERNVLGLVLDAKEASAAVVAFLRDADDDLERPTTITVAIDRARIEFPTIDVIGGCAIPVLEAMRGELKTEEMRKVAAQTRLESRATSAKKARLRWSS